MTIPLVLLHGALGSAAQLSERLTTHDVTFLGEPVSSAIYPQETSEAGYKISKNIRDANEKYGSDAF